MAGNAEGVEGTVDSLGKSLGESGPVGSVEAEEGGVRAERSHQGPVPLRVAVRRYSC
jgi:hypothetical protein